MSSYVIFGKQSDLIAAAQSDWFWEKQFLGNDVKKFQNPYSEENVSIRGLMSSVKGSSIVLRRQSYVERVIVATTKQGIHTIEVDEEIAEVYRPRKRSLRKISFLNRTRAAKYKGLKMYRWTREKVLEPVSHVAVQAAGTVHAYTVGDDFDRELRKQQRKRSDTGITF